MDPSSRDRLPLAEWAVPARRIAAAARSAQQLGVEALLIFVRDPELGVLLPAPGFPRTLPGGSTWTEFLARCAQPGEHCGEVAFPVRATRRPVTAYADEHGVVYALIGAAAKVSLASLEAALPPLPILSALLSAEAAAAAAAGQAAAARDAVRHATALARALDAARVEIETKAAAAGRALSEADRLNRELQNALHDREQFISIVSHDLRNPLTAISGMAEMMLLRGDLSPAGVKSATRIAASAERMHRMIEQLLDFSRARSVGGIPLHPTEVDLTAVCREVLAEFDAAYPERTIRLIGADSIVGHWDPDRLAQVVSNLVGNALQHGAPDKPIEIGVRRQDAATAFVSVHNANRERPIPVDVLPHIFDPFRRGESDRRTDGLGLGLYIAREIVAAHRGTIEAQSDDSGTTFAVLLPLARADGSAWPQGRRSGRATTHRQRPDGRCRGPSNSSAAVTAAE